MIKDYIKLAFKTLIKRKTRTALTLLGIIISISVLFILISTSIGLQNSIEEQFRLLGTDKFFLQGKGQIGGPGSIGAETLTDTDLNIIKKVQGVKETSAWIYASAEIKFKNEIRYVTIVATEIESMDLFRETGPHEPEDGRLLKKGDTTDIIIGSQYKHDNYFKTEIIIGDNGQDYKVRGILKPLGNPVDDKLIYMSTEQFRKQFNTGERIDNIIVQIEEGEDTKEIAENVKRKLIKSRGVTEKTIDFDILTPEEILSTFNVILGILTGFLISIAGISLIVGGIGIANTMYTSVLERTKDIGIMKAIGAQRKDILLIFLIESGMLGLFGGVIGIIIGYAISKAIESIANNQLGTTLLQIATPPWLIIGSLLFSFIAGSISGLLPAWQATKIKPVDALRYE